eukprot:4160169-Prymnesium_polylepis.1
MPDLRQRTGSGFRTPPPRKAPGVASEEFITSDPAKRRRRQSSPIDTIYMDGQKLLRNAIMHNHASRSSELHAYTRALNKFDQVPDGHNYAADFKMLCREIIARLDGGQESATECLVSSLSSAPMLVQRLPSE